MISGTSGSILAAGFCKPLSGRHSASACETSGASLEVQPMLSTSRELMLFSAEVASGHRLRPCAAALGTT
jgi:hypothetical protein